jgi:predicted acyltransferase
MLRRSLLLLAIGLAYNAIMSGTTSFDDLHFLGPLQVYAVLVLVIGMLHLVLRGPLGWGLATLAVAGVQASVLAAYQAGCPSTELTPACNPSRAIDFAMFGVSHVYRQGASGHDPEGLVSILGALVTATVGTTAGHIALKYRRSWRAPALLVVWAVTAALLSLGASDLLPAMKRLWTTPFALGVAALGVACFAVFIVVLDRKTFRAWDRVRGPLTYPLVALGRNSLLVYFGSHLLLHVLDDHGGEVTWAQTLSERVDVLGDPELSYMLFMVLLWVAVTAVLHQRRIYLRP